MSLTATGMRPLGPMSERIGKADLERGAAIRNIDWTLVVATVGLACYGTLMVFSATKHQVNTPVDNPYFLNRQAVFVTLGAMLMCAIAAIDYRRLRYVATAFYVLNMVALLLVVSPLATNIKGQARFDLPGGVQIQPSEFTKISVILMLASWFGRDRSDGAREPIDLRRLLMGIMLLATPVALIMLQPDLGTALVFLVVAGAVFVVGGVKGRYLLALALLSVCGVVGVLRLGVLSDYQQDRLTVFIDPKVDPRGAGFNLAQAKVAIGSGGLLGKGLYNGSQTKLRYVPEQRTDFIFTVVGEELGFAGSAGMLALFAVVLWRVWKAAKNANDGFGSLLCVGVLAMLTFQLFENAGMTMGIMPVTGIPLPFVSYGGSSILACFLAIGLVLNVRMRRYA